MKQYIPLRIHIEKYVPEAQVPASLIEILVMERISFAGYLSALCSLKT
ncbi:MAG: hypothetical protein LUQ04_08915 [Methanoregula sp.]|nr:hypothetical protein [Methanoregula sp.]